MNFKRITIITLTIVLFSSINSFAGGVIRNTTIEAVKQDAAAIRITYDNLQGSFVTRIVSAQGVEKNILAIALTAQSSGMNVDIEVDSGYIIAVTIVSP